MREACCAGVCIRPPLLVSWHTLRVFASLAYIHPLGDGAVQEGLPSSQHALRSEARLVFAIAAPHFGRHTYCAEPLRTASLHGAPPCAQ